LLKVIQLWRSENHTISFTNGVFDLVHVGHLKSLQVAASFADRLIVGVNSDKSARGLNKGAGRPLNCELDRATLIAGLKPVSAVVIFDEPTPYEILSVIRPDVLVKGADYQLEQIIGREFAGRVERVELIPGISTTELVRRIRALPKED